jgi:hypothetical protein
MSTVRYDMFFGFSSLRHRPEYWSMLAASSFSSRRLLHPDTPPDYMPAAASPLADIEYAFTEYGIAIAATR